MGRRRRRPPVPAAPRGRRTALVLSLLSSLAAVACAEDGGVEVRDPPDPVARVEVEPAGMELDVGATGTFVATVYAASGSVVDSAVTWSAERPEVAAVVDGEATALAAGETRVVATAAGVAGDAELTVVEPLPPAGPSGVVAVALSDVAVEVGWRDNATDETRFVIERAEDASRVADTGPGDARPGKGSDGADFEAVGETGPDRTTYTDEGLAPGTAYRYRVRACNEAGCSDPAPLPEPVTTLDALELSSLETPAGATNQGYRHRFHAEGATGSFRWEVADGRVPPGLELAADGVLTGVPEARGAFAFQPRVVSGEQSARAEVEVEVGDVLTFDGNPLMWGADPAAHAWIDGRLWLYPTTDAHDWDDLTGWHAWSSDDLRTWTRHRDIFTADQCAWCSNNAWALDIAYKDRWYYLYYYFRNDGKRPRGIGVARSRFPDGPFDNLTPYGPLVDGHDPAVFQDDDGRAYLYTGHVVYFLEPDMASLEQENGRDRKVVLEFRGGEPEGGFEGVWVFERDGLYYLTLADGDYRRLSYYTSDSPTGPFVRRGVILDEVDGVNVHHSVVEWRGRWMLFFHLWPEAGPGQRRIFAEPLSFRPDGTIEPVTVTEEGVGSS